MYLTLKKGCVDEMKKLPKVNLNYEGLYKMLVAPLQSTLLLTGIELKVFDQL